MRKIIISETETNDIPVAQINQTAPVFAKEDGKLVGMIVKENKGWILRVGYGFGAYGWSDSLVGCVAQGINEFKYEFFTN